MAINQDELLRELLQDFEIEAEEHLSSIDEGLIVLENGSENPDKSVLEKVYRETHSLKGAARAVNLTDTEKICMLMENVMSSLKNGEGSLFNSLFDVMHKSVDSLRFMLSNIKESGTERKLPNLPLLIKNLEFIHKEVVKKEENESQITKQKTSGKENTQIPEVPKKVETESETIRISSQKLNKILAQSEDFIAFKTTLAFYKSELEEIRVRIKDDKLEYLYGDLTRFIHVANRMVDDIIIDVKSTLLLPFSTILNIVPRVVRDLTRDNGKEIEVEIKGDFYEIDKRILEELKDPLIHLIRNCADHGIESPKERSLSGKSTTGKISIVISKDADAKLSISVCDDGGGIKIDKVIKSAIKNGIIDHERAELLSSHEKMNLIFSSGVSSSDMITEISGRGLGMAIVSEKICNLGGTVSVDSEYGKGTKFIIKIPQTIATFRGLLVTSFNQQFLIPSNFIEKVIGVVDSEIINSGHRTSVLISGDYVGLMDLGKSLGLTETVQNDSKFKPALILNSNHKRMAFKVDKIIEEVEGIIKPLGKQLKGIKKITGVTMVGNGVLIPVVNVNELIEGATGGDFGGFTDTSKITTTLDQKQRILVVEDSITVRSMLKSIVENAGYETDVAVDGVEAYKMLQETTYDAVVTDIEMPNMNGFELTTKIRGDSRYSEIPVILVTTLESPKDMQRGLDAGANAYIVKGSFEKSNLTDTIRRLI